LIVLVPFDTLRALNLPKRLVLVIVLESLPWKIDHEREPV
jgi:hypothetical protein